MRLESSALHPDMISSSNTRALQEVHREQLEIRTSRANWLKMLVLLVY